MLFSPTELGTFVLGHHLHLQTLHTPACKNIKGAYFIVPGHLLHLKHLSSVGASTWEVWTNWQ